MRWILSIVALCLVGAAVSEAGLFRHRRSGAGCGDCAPPAASACAGSAPVQAQGCYGSQMERPRLFHRRARGGCGG